MAEAAAAHDLQIRTGMDAKWEALAKLEALAEEAEACVARNKANGCLRRAIKAWRRGNFPRAAKLALDAVNADETYGASYHLLAIALERLGFKHKALVTYQRALELAPENANLLIDLGMTAWHMGMKETAEAFFRRFIAVRPDDPMGYNNLASVLADTDRSTLAIEVLRDAIHGKPTVAALWNTLATILAEDGRVDESLVFYQEALRIDPELYRARHNVAFAYLHAGKDEEAVQAVDEALVHLTDPFDRLEARHTRSIALMGMGRLEEGFEEYEVRTDQLFRGCVPHMLSAPVWNGEPLEGKRLLVCAEQGLGDEIMLANTLPDLDRAVGPSGKLQIAVNHRLVSLFKRTFPDADVGVFEDRAVVNADGTHPMRFAPFATKDRQPDYYIRMGSTLRLLRKRVEDFPDKPLLKPDPERVAKYRAQLTAGDARPTVGLCWQSMRRDLKRAKYYSMLDQWGPVLTMPGVHFVNVQYGDCSEDLARVCSKLGVTIEVIDGLDLTNDIDGAAALSAAIDLVISPSTASAAIAAAVGTEVWFVNPCRMWPQLGTDRMPFYPNTRAFYSESFGDWATLIPRVAGELATYLAQR